ncbi:MAG TPA: hypothetical protein VFP44_10085 [Usitatibacter sp.]|nr:hypothetical protein [Usitatibacter sp.]
MSWLRYALQVPAYAAFAAFVGYFSSAPAYHPIAPGRAVVKLSFIHAGERKAACHTRTPEELAKLAPNMRAPQDCPRERSDVLVQLDMDGKALYRIEARPAGLRHDLPATVFRRLEIPAGRHHFRARLADTADGAFRHEGEATLDLPEGRVLVIDFVAPQGFVFRT